MTRTLIVLRPPLETPDRLSLSSNSTTRRLLGHTGSDFMWYPEASVEGGSLLIDLTVSGTQTIDRGVAENHDYTLTGYTVLTLIGAIADKATDLRVVLRQDSTGSRTVAWPSTITWEAGSIPTLQTAASALDVIGLLSVDDGATWLGFHDDPTLSDLSTLGLVGTIVMSEGVTDPPEPVWNEAGTDYVYSEPGQ